MAVVNGTPGDDTLLGGVGDDSLSGFAGNDTLDGGAGRDTLVGGLGNDTYFVDLIRPSTTTMLEDVVVESLGSGFDDTLLLRADEDFTLGPNFFTVALGANLEHLDFAATGTLAIRGTGNSLDNTIIGNAGDNTLTGGLGTDVLIGGAGNDIYVVDRAEELTLLEDDAGVDVLVVNYTTIAPQTIELTGFLAEIERVQVLGGGVFNLTGNGASNLLQGNASASRIDGGAGVDFMMGGGGNDTFVVDNAADKVSDDSGIDTVESSVSYSLVLLGSVVEQLPRSFIEKLTLTGSADIDGTGNAVGNVLTGNSGINTLTGLAGSDTYVVQNSGDVVVEALNAGTDTVVASATFILSDNIEALALALDAGDIDGTGNAGANTITGNADDNVIDGAAGKDQLKGGAGNDTYFVDLIRPASTTMLEDTVTEALNAGIDTLVLRAGGGFTLASPFTALLGANFENLDFSATGTLAMGGTGNSLNNAITGNGGNNLLSGMAGNDSLLGGLGNDTLAGGLGTDTLVGGDGDDFLFIGGADALAFLMSGFPDDTRYIGGAGIDTLIYTGANPTSVPPTITLGFTGFLFEGILLGTSTGAVSGTTVVHIDASDFVGWGMQLTGNAAGNRLTGTNHGDVLTGNAGNDTLIALAGDDTLNGGAGADSMEGGMGNDIFVVAAATEHVLGERIDGGEDSDTLRYAGTLAATLTLTNFVIDLEQVEIAAGTAAINVNASVVGNALTITGNAGNNALTGTASNDTINGGDGNDVLIGGAGNDNLNGGNGNDVILIAAGAHHGAGEVIDGGIGNNIIRFTSAVAGTLTLSGSVTNITEVEASDAAGSNAGAAAINIDAAAVGSGLTLTGNAGLNVLTGTGFNDVLAGNAGNDTLNGAAGADVMTGGSGNDTFIVDDAGDQVSDVLGIDTVQSSITYTLGPTTEKLTLTGDGDIDGTGNALANVLTGNSGINTLTGLAGSDTYIVQNDDDVVVEALNAGTDTVVASVSYTLSENVELLTLTGAADIDGTGNAAANTIKGNAGSNVLDGAGGRDVLVGGAGNDAYHVDLVRVSGITSLQDVVTEGTNAGNDTLIVDATGLVQPTPFTVVLATNLENLTLTGDTANLNATGNSVANVIFGNEAANVITGLGGADQLFGAGGDDTFIWDPLDAGIDGGSGTDTLKVNGANVSIDLAAVPMTHVEVINLTGTGNNTLTLTADDVLAVADDGTLRVDGNAGDVVNRGEGWELGEDTVVSANTYHTFTHGEATLLVDTDVSVFGTPAVPVGDSVALTGNNDIDGLAQGGSWQFPDSRIITYSLNSIFFPGFPVRSWTPALTEAIDRAFDAWSDVLDIDFVRVKSGTLHYQSQADFSVNVGGTELTLLGVVGLGIFPDPEAADEFLAAIGDTRAHYPRPEGDMAFNVTAQFFEGEFTLVPTPIFSRLDPGQIGYYVMLHEIGHALGLKHAFDDGGNGRPFFNPDQLRHTLMSSEDPFDLVFPGTPMAYDIQALQHIYGANEDFHAGDDVYLIAPGPLRSIWDAGGVDMLKVDQAAGTVLDLRPGEFSGATPGIGLGIPGRISIAFGAVIENAEGAAGNDTITGNDAANQLSGDAGNDSLQGGDGDDTLAGGDGNDTLLGGAGLDFADYSAAPGAVAVTLGGSASGGAGDDTVASDIEGVIGSPFDDTFTGSGATNWLDYSPAAAAVTVNLSTGLASGGAGNDAISGFEAVRGSAFDDELTAAFPGSWLDGGAGNDTMIGAGGNDTFVAGAGDTIIELAPGGGIDEVRSATPFTLGSNLDNLVLTGDGDIDGTGNASANHMLGNSGANMLDGDAGDDTLDGGGGADTLVGGEGNDSYSVDQAGDEISEDSGGSADLVHSEVSFTLGGGLEDLILAGVGNIDGTGNELGNHIVGNAGNNALDGGAGNDTLDAGAGADMLAGGAGDDTYTVDEFDAVTEAAEAGIDTVVSSISMIAPANVENLTLTGALFINGIGNAFDNLINGNAVDNLLMGGDGNDTLMGANGADTLDGGEGDDSLYGGAGDDSMSGGGGNDVYVLDDIGPELSVQVDLGDTTRHVEVNDYFLFLLDSPFDEDLLLDSLSVHALDATGFLNFDVSTRHLGVPLQPGTYTDTMRYPFETAGHPGLSVGLDGVGANTSTGSFTIDVLEIDDSGDTPLVLEFEASFEILLDGFLLWTGTISIDADPSGPRDTVVEESNEGRDRVETPLPYVLPDNVEDLTLTGDAEVNGGGNALANLLTGNSANNALDGAAGNDTLISGGGSDAYTGDDGNDVFVIDAADHLVATIADYVQGTDRLGLGEPYAALFVEGVLDDSVLLNEAAATELTHRLLYDPAAGSLYYDADGSDAGAAVQVASLQTGLTLSAADFVFQA